jgi:hypothetical protein
MHAKISHRIAAPHDRVFAMMSDFANAPSRITGIARCEMLTTGPVGKGTRFRETRKMFGREQTETMEVVEWNPPSHYTLEANSCGCLYRFTISCEPDRGMGGDSNATIVQASFEGKPLTFMAKLFSPLGKLMSGMCRKALQKDLEDIERSLSAPPSAPSVVQPA